MHDGNDTIEQEAISALWGLLELATAQVANAGGLRLAEPTLMGLCTVLIEHRLDDKAADYVAAADTPGARGHCSNCAPTRLFPMSAVG